MFRTDLSLRHGSGAAVILAATLAIATPGAALDVPVSGTNGMISAGHPVAVQSGLKALQAGGTACDAAVAVATTLSVMMTDMMGPLGSGYALLYDAKSKKVTAVDFNGMAPAATDPKKFTMQTKLRGVLAPTVPGNLKGWEEVHKRCGVLPWASLWTDAINYAANGRVIDVDTAAIIRRHIPEIGTNETWAKEFLIKGTEPPAAGHVHKRPELAQTYRVFAKSGSSSLYSGPIGDKVVAYMQKNGGLITKKDLAAYKVNWIEPIKTTYRGHTVYGVPPSSSSITWMETLKILEGYDLKALKHNSPDYLRTHIEAAKYAYEDAYRHVGDLAFVKTPIEKLLSDAYAADLRKKLDSEKVRAFRPIKVGYAHPAPMNSATSHLVIVDKQGNAVSMTNTLGTFFGAGIVVEGTGLLMSNGMDWFDIDHNIWTGEKPGVLGMVPGKRNRWTLSPGMIFKDNKPYMLVGGAGAESTMWGISQPIVNVIDFGMNPQQALSAPRFRYGDTYHYTGGTHVGLENGIPAETGNALKEMGYDVDAPGKPRNLARGTTNMIVIDPASGAYWGGAAPNGRDFVAGY